MDMVDTLANIKIMVILYLLGAVTSLVCTVVTAVMLVQIRGLMETQTYTLGKLTRPSPRPRRVEHL